MQNVCKSRFRALYHIFNNGLSSITSLRLVSTQLYYDFLQSITIIHEVVINSYKLCHITPEIVDSKNNKDLRDRQNEGQRFHDAVT
jgi:hypothetical protein